MTMGFWWFAVVALCLIMYIVLDGYDLGIGSSLIFEPRAERRYAATQVVARTWDANESWLILLALTIWAGFPQAFGVMVPHLYIPLLLMLFGLILRGACVEMASQRGAPSRMWVWLFCAGSLLAAASQGMAFGATMEAVPLNKEGLYAGGPLDFLTPFTGLTALTSVLLYMALGYTYLARQTTGEMRDASAGRGRVVISLAGVAAAITALSTGATAGPLNLDGPGRVIPFTILVVIVFIAGVIALKSMRSENSTGLPFRAMSAGTIAGFLAYWWARYPMLLPPKITVDEAVSPPSTMIFLLIAVGINIPLVLFYMWFAHRTFGGRIVATEERTAARNPEGVTQ